MNKAALIGIAIAQLYLPAHAFAQGEPSFEQPMPPDGITFAPPEKPVKAKPIGKLEVRLGDIANGKPIAPRFAYCAPDGKGGTFDGQNISPAINWTDGPPGTQSYALIVVDKDVPASFDNANQAGKEIPVKAPRQNFYHWVLVDIPPSIKGLLEGKNSNGITPGGKPTGRTTYGTNGRNDYAKIYKGSFGGYDGPCPPWNDLRLHHYHFIVYALDIPSLDLPSPITGRKAEVAMEGHILAKGEAVGTYSTHPRWLPTLKAQLAEQARAEKEAMAVQQKMDVKKERNIEIKTNIRRQLEQKNAEPPKEVTPNDLIDTEITHPKPAWMKREDSKKE